MPEPRADVQRAERQIWRGVRPPRQGSVRRRYEYVCRVSLRDRWTKRGPAWRFPSRQEAAENLREGLRPLARPWVVATVAIAIAAVLFLTWGDRDNTVALTGAAVGIAGFLRIVAPRLPPRRR